MTESQFEEGLELGASRWDELICLHSVLYELYDPEDEKLQELTIRISEIELGYSTSRPFILFGQQAVEALAQLEEIRDSREHVYSELAQEMIEGVPEYLHARDIGISDAA